MLGSHNDDVTKFPHERNFINDAVVFIMGLSLLRWLFDGSLWEGLP